VQAVKAPKAAGREEGTVVVAWKEQQPYSTAVFVAADEAKDGGYNGEYCGINVLGSGRVLGECIDDLQAP
jgi:hypothetical protein